MLELPNFDYTILLRLVAAVILGGAIGLERGVNHDAGLRTHIIVCLGAAAVMVVSECLVQQYGIKSEIMRMGAQVISGVGFLGAGSIIVDGSRVRGITTAAGLWTTACVGLVVGSGYYIIAAAMVILMLFAMLGLRSITLKLQSKSLMHSIQIETTNREILQNILQNLIDKHVEIKSVKISESSKNHSIIGVLEMRFPSAGMTDELMTTLSGCEGVSEFIWI